MKKDFFFVTGDTCIATSSTVNEMGFTCGTHVGEEKGNQSLAGKPEGQEKLRRPRKRWEDNIKMDVNIRNRGSELDSYGTE